MCGSGRPTFHSPKSSWMNAWNSASSPETLRARRAERESARARARGACERAVDRAMSEDDAPDDGRDLALVRHVVAAFLELWVRRHVVRVHLVEGEAHDAREHADVARVRPLVRLLHHLVQIALREAVRMPHERHHWPRLGRRERGACRKGAGGASRA